MAQKLKDRINHYHDLYDFKLLNKLPVIITINGRNFNKITSLLEKPFDNLFSEILIITTQKLCSEIDGAIFAYQYNDEITIIALNDQNQDTMPWFDNKIQKIVSITSAIATLQFNTAASTSGLNLIGSPIFSCQSFVVPNISEAINTIIYKQQSNFYNSVQSACFYELLKLYDKNTIKDMLLNMNIDEKIALLQQECNIDFNLYPSEFRRGVAIYKSPKLVGEVMKNKWVVNTNPPIFTKDPLLNNVFKLGQDLIRKD